MSLSDCPECWDTPCSCGYEYYKYGSTLTTPLYLIPQVTWYKILRIFGKDPFERKQIPSLRICRTCGKKEFSKEDEECRNPDCGQVGLVSYILLKDGYYVQVWDHGVIVETKKVDFTPAGYLDLRYLP